MKPFDLAIVLFVVTIWGLNFVFVKIGVAEIPPFLFMALRFGVVALILVPFIKWPHGRGKALIAYSMMLGVIHFGLMFNAIHLIDASTVALLSQLNTPFAVILSAVLFRDYPGWKRVLGIAIAFGGCFVIAGEPRFDGALLPILMVVGGTFAWAVAAVQAKQLGSIGPFALNGWMALFATPPLLLISLATETPSLVTVGAPKDLSNTTLRPFGPRVTLTASARVFTPLSILARAESENLTSLAAIFVSLNFSVRIARSESLQAKPAAAF